MTDAHQVNTIIATAIHECRNGPFEPESDAEEAKQIAKCIMKRLRTRGLKSARAKIKPRLFCVETPYS
jgi:hypothetical protein